MRLRATFLALPLGLLLIQVQDHPESLALLEQGHSHWGVTCNSCGWRMGSMSEQGVRDAANGHTIATNYTHTQFTVWSYDSGLVAGSSDLGAAGLRAWSLR